MGSSGVVNLAGNILSGTPSDGSTLNSGNVGGACKSEAKILKTGHLLSKQNWPLVSVVDASGQGTIGSETKDLRPLTKLFGDDEKGTDAFIWIVDIGNPRITEQHKKCLSLMASTFGPGFVRNLVILFTE